MVTFRRFRVGISVEIQSREKFHRGFFSSQVIILKEMCVTFTSIHGDSFVVYKSGISYFSKWKKSTNDLLRNII